MDLELAPVRAYGHSYLTWPSPRTWLARLAHRHGWTLTNAGWPSELAQDAAYRVIGASSPHRWQPGAAGLALVQCAANDLTTHGQAGLAGYRNALRALLAHMSLEGPLDSSGAVPVSGTWQHNPAPEWHGGSHLTGQGVAHLWAAGRGGRWAVGYYGIASTSNGGSFRLYAEPGARLLGTFQVGGQTLGSATRSWTACAALVDLTAPADYFRLVKTDNREGPYLDWWGHLWEDPAPRIVVVGQPYLSAAGRSTWPNATDAAVDAYNMATAQVAGEVGPHVLYVDPTPGWDALAMMLPDGIHPNDHGHRHLADAVDAALVAP